MIFKQKTYNHVDDDGVTEGNCVNDLQDAISSIKTDPSIDTSDLCESQESTVYSRSTGPLELDFRNSKKRKCKHKGKKTKKHVSPPPPPPPPPPIPPPPPQANKLSRQDQYALDFAQGDSNVAKCTVCGIFLRPKSLKKHIETKHKNVCNNSINNTQSVKQNGASETVYVKEEETRTIEKMSG